MDHQMFRRQQQARSNSIGDHEFGLGGHQRLKKSVYMHQSPYIDANQYYSQRQRYNNGQYQQNPSLADRSLSPMVNLGSRTGEINAIQRAGSIRYPPDKPIRSHHHASLECLNVVYSDYSQNQKQPPLPQQHPQLQQQLQQQQQQSQQLPRYHVGQQQYSNLHQLQNQHYATSYIQAPAPAESVISQNTEHDLAAAAMGSGPPQHYSQMIPITSSSNAIVNPHNNYLNQSLLNQRSNTPVSHSPLHRRISTQSHTSGSSLINQLAGNSNNHPIRAGHSSLSLVSSTNLIEDKLQQEIKRLLSELRTEREKNEALSSQLNINTNLMSAFEQSLSALNNRVRQLSTINERKDAEIEELRRQLADSNLLVQPLDVADGRSSRLSMSDQRQDVAASPSDPAVTVEPIESDKLSEQNLLKIIDDLKRQLIEKDRLLTDTRLEALSAAHQLEQLEASFNGDRGGHLNEEDLDEGVMVANRSPSDSDAITDPTNFSELTSQTDRINDVQQHHQNKQQPCYRQTRNDPSSCDITSHAKSPANENINNNNTSNNIIDSNNTSSLSNSYNSNHSADSEQALNRQQHQHYETQYHKQPPQDNQSNHSSSDYHVEDKSPGDNSSQHKLGSERNLDRYNDEESEAMSRLLDTMLVGN